MSGHGGAPGRWLGRGAAALGQDGIATTEAFVRVFHGRHPGTGSSWEDSHMPLPAATIITGQDEQTLCCWTRSGSIPTPAFDHVLVIARFAGGSTDTRTLALSSARWPRPAATTGGGA